MIRSTFERIRASCADQTVSLAGNQTLLACNA
jgi:hypothetical protein